MAFLFFLVFVSYLKQLLSAFIGYMLGAYLALGLLAARLFLLSLYAVGRDINQFFARVR